MEQEFTINKVLAVHWRWSNIHKDSWKLRKEIFKENWMELDLFQFAPLEDPSYEDWEVTFRDIDFSRYDAIYTSSLWWVMTLRYMYENNLTIKRIVMAVPWISFSALEWKKPNLYKLHQDFWTPDVSNIAEEKYVLSARDDDDVPYQSWEEVAKITNADFILLENWGHKLEWHSDLIVSLVKNWK